MYQLTSTFNIVKRLADQAFIPVDAENADYQRYVAWRAEGNEPQPAPAPPVAVPQSVSRAQAKIALLRAGYLAQVETALNSIPSVADKTEALIWWNEAQDFQRNNSLVLMLGQALGLDIDQLFIAAAEIE